MISEVCISQGCKKYMEVAHKRLPENSEKVYTQGGRGEL